MLLVIVVIYYRLRPRHVKRLWPVLVPALVLIHVALPGTIGTIKSSFFPKGGLIAQQSSAEAGSGRVSSLGPGFTVFGDHPILGVGYGSRVVDGPHPNAIIYDDQWLSTAVETGIIGVFAWVWLFVRFGRRLAKAARLDHSHRGWCLIAFQSAVVSYGVGMFFYDAFSFIQVTILMFIMLALGMVVLKLPQDDASVRPVAEPHVADFSIARRRA
jgi:O-antigen ligase